MSVPEPPYLLDVQVMIRVVHVLCEQEIVEEMILVEQAKAAVVLQTGIRQVRGSTRPLHDQLARPT
jgi:hypothetical protein